MHGSPMIVIGLPTTYALKEVKGIGMAAGADCQVISGIGTWEGIPLTDSQCSLRMRRQE